MAVYGDEFFGEQCGIAVLLAAIRDLLRLTSAGMIEHSFDAAEFDNQLHAALVANAGYAGYVIHRVAAQGHHIDDLLRRNAQNFYDLGGVENQVVLLRVENLHRGRDQLHHVLVAADDEDLVLLAGGLAGEGSDHVVGLEALGLQDGNAQGLEGAADVGNLAAQVFGHRGAIGLVALVAHLVEALRLAVPLAQWLHGAGALVAEDLAAHVEDGGKVMRRENPGAAS
jgi:hypothetical protein